MKAATKALTVKTSSSSFPSTATSINSKTKSNATS
jgi:hypothetical protein